MSIKASSRCYLPRILKGQRMIVCASSSCGSTANIVLKDDKEVYATFKKQTYQNAYQSLGHDSKMYNGGSNLRLEVDMEHPSFNIKIQQIVTFTDTTDSSGGSYGGVYNISIDDYNNNNYNNLTITIVTTPN